MSVLKHVGFFLLPVSVAAIGAAWHLDMLPRLAIKPALETSQAKVEFARTVTSNFESLRYPNEPQLMPLQREWLTAELPRDVDSFASEEYANNTLVPGEQALLASSERRVKTSPTINSDDDLGLSLGDLDLSSLSPDLALKVERALANNDQPLPSQVSRVGDLEREAKQWFGRLPALNLQTHMYASDAKRRWVKINNVEYHQGDVVEGQVTLKEILPQAVIVEFQGEQIRIPALYEWQG